MRDIAEVIGAGLGVPIRSLSAERKLPQNLREKVEGSHGDASIVDRAFDVATGAAARLLHDRCSTGREDVPVLGLEDLSFSEVAGIISEVLGRQVRYQQAPFDGSKAQLKERGMSEDFTDIPRSSDVMTVPNGVNRLLPVDKGN